MTGFRTLILFVNILFYFKIVYSVSELPKMAIGSTDFTEILKTDVFVDKTALIKALFKDNIVFITAPPGFGKSTNLNMAKHFFEIMVDEKGKPLDVKTTPNYHLFEDNNLKIFQYKQFCNQHFGKYPVVNVNYGHLNVTTYEGMLTSFRKILNETFQEHTYLVRNSKLWLLGEKEVFMKFVNNSDALDEHDMNFALKFLCRLLRDHFKKKVIVLVDDYNNYFNNFKNTNEEEKEEIVSFLKWINNDLLKINPFLDRAILTGILADGLLRPRTINRYNLLDRWIVKFFGIRDKEVKVVLKKIFKDEFRNVIKLFEKESIHMQSYSSVGKLEFTFYSYTDFLNFVEVNLKKI